MELFRAVDWIHEVPLPLRSPSSPIFNRSSRLFLEMVVLLRLSFALRLYFTYFTAANCWRLPPRVFPGSNLRPPHIFFFLCGGGAFASFPSLACFKFSFNSTNAATLYVDFARILLPFIFMWPRSSRTTSWSAFSRSAIFVSLSTLLCITLPICTSTLIRPPCDISSSF